MRLENLKMCDQPTAKTAETRSRVGFRQFWQYPTRTKTENFLVAVVAAIKLPVICNLK
jgi:hypothetical protein